MSKYVFNKLSYKILYKSYPEENKRYADKNPVLEEAKISKNIKLFTDIVDMRYFISNFKVFITSRATSTLSWLVFSNKPVIFINWINDNQLNQEAYESFSKGIFVFNSNDEYFYEKLFKFLSLPISEIESLYENKKEARTIMIKEYFSEYNYGAGNRIANFLGHKFLNY